MLDTLRPAGEQIRALHLGGGALTLPRYVAATRSGSSQVVVEHDAELISLVLTRLPLPADTDIQIVIADARQAIASLRAADVRPFDAVVVDLYARRPRSSITRRSWADASGSSHPAGSSS